MWHSFASGFIFNDTATTEIYTLSLHDALPIFLGQLRAVLDRDPPVFERMHDARVGRRVEADRKSTRLNSSHANISYAVFCLKKTTHHADTTLKRTNTKTP